MTCFRMTVIAVLVLQVLFAFKVSQYFVLAETPSSLYFCKSASLEAARSWTIPSSFMVDGLETSFRLVQRQADLSCSKRELSVQLNAFSPEIQFLANGYLKNGTEIRSNYHPSSTYCIHKISDTSIDIRLCEQACSLKGPCIRKCCPMDKLFSTSPPYCKSNADSPPWQPVFYENVYDERTKFRLWTNNTGRVKYEPWFFMRMWNDQQWKRSCPSGFAQIIYDRKQGSSRTGRRTYKKFRVTTNGQLMLWSFQAREWEVQHGPFCIDGTDDGQDSVSILCEPEYKPQGAPNYYGIINITTSFFALATFLVHVLLWEKQNIHSWTIMSFSVSLFLFFLLVGTAHLTSSSDDFVGTTLCTMIGTTAHFFLISTFCWLAIISLDLYSTFRAILVTKSRGIKRYIFYTILGWGLPLAVVITSWILELTYGSDPYSTVKVPQYGQRNCYLTQYAMTQYVYGPCTVLYILNLFFFGLTLSKLVEYKKSTKFARNDLKRDRQSFILFVKLFFVTGVLWIIELCGWYLEDGKAKWYWMILDLGNCLQPVALFLIFVIKADVLNSLNDKYSCFRPITRPFLLILAYLDGKFGKTSTRPTNLSMSNSSTKSGTSTLSTETTLSDTTEL